MGGKARWVPHDKNPVDPMTKIGGNVQPLLDLMRKSKYKLIVEEDEMDDDRDLALERILMNWKGQPKLGDHSQLVTGESLVMKKHPAPCGPG